jgi:hypothetical protein
MMGGEAGADEAVATAGLAGRNLHVTALAARSFTAVKRSPPIGC